MRTLRDNIQAGQALIRLHNEDNRRGEFLRAIDADEMVLLSDFEARFVGDFVTARAKREVALDFQWFTPGRRAVVDSMIHRYGFRTTRRAEGGVRNKLPEAAAGCCGYLVRNDDTNRRECCGAKATVTTGRGLELCATHAATRAAELAQLRAAKDRLRR